MRMLAGAGIAAALLLGAAPALAHQGNPHYRSTVERITPPVKGVTATVLNFDDRIQIQNTSGRTVVIDGYDGKPYARLLADRTVQVNTNNPAYYLNDDRYADATVPKGLGTTPKWKLVDRTGRFEWHDHRSHYMSPKVPPKVTDQDKRTFIFDWKVPIEVDGAQGHDRRHAVLGPAPARVAADGADLGLGRGADPALAGRVRDPAAALGAGAGARPRRHGETARSRLRRRRAAARCRRRRDAHATLEATAPQRGARLDAPPRAGRAALRRVGERVARRREGVRRRAATRSQQGVAFHPGGRGDGSPCGCARGLPDGGYTATYRVISADSHPVSGGFTFTVGDGRRGLRVGRRPAEGPVGRAR